jgi:hypothetical protein
MDEIPGVACCSANESGTLIRLALTPGADPERVVVEAERALRSQSRDRVGVVLRGSAATVALRGEQWVSPSQVAESLTAGTRSPRSRSTLFALFWALILASVVDGLMILWLLRRERSLAEAAAVNGDGPKPTVQPTRAA